MCVGSCIICVYTVALIASAFAFCAREMLHINSLVVFQTLALISGRSDSQSLAQGAVDAHA